MIPALAARIPALLFLTMATAMALAGCQAPRATSRLAAPIPAPVPSGVKLVWSGSYSEHVQPIFNRRCVTCHGRDKAENGLRLTSFREVMKGTQYGPVVVPGSPSHSTLVSVVRGTADSSLRMPPGERRLGDQEVQNLVLWIEAGAPPH